MRVELDYDKEKYREMILDTADTVLGYFGFNRTVYENPRDNRKKRKWYGELQEERAKVIQIFRQRCCDKVIQIVYP